MEPNRLETKRLTLVPATLPMLRSELTNPAEFARLLGAQIASPWPPPLNDEQSNQWMIRCMEQDVGGGIWGMWYFVLREGPSGAPIAIGNGGFKGKPTLEGTVEIGYSIVEAYQKIGLGAEAVRALVDFAFEKATVQSVTAETLPHLVGSIRVLVKNGFHLTGLGSEPDTIRFELRRDKNHV